MGIRSGKSWAMLGLAVALALSGCSGSSVPSGQNSNGSGTGSGSTNNNSGSNNPGSGGGSATATAKTFTICPGPDAQTKALEAFFEARAGDTIQFCAGHFDFTKSLMITGVSDITIEGAGRDKTILSFAKSTAEDGVSIDRSTGMTIQNLTIYDAPGNGLRIFRTDYVTVNDVKVGWSDADPASPNYDASMKSWVHNGSYAFYPVLCHHVLIEDSVSIGSSDAGVYVGQSNDILVRNTEAFHNVAGFEFENTYRGEFVDNIAHDNVGGFLVFDLPGRAQSGEKNLVHNNESFNNNIPTFAAHGAIVSDVPQGTGMLILATDQLEVYDNDIHNNNTFGIGIINYGLADSSEKSTKYDFYPEGIHIYSNTLTDNGQRPALPDLTRDSCTGSGGLPGKGDKLTCLTDNASLLPAILVLKNLGRSAQIIWDGARDTPNGCTSVPTDRYGVPLNQPDPKDTTRYEARVDERGRPNFDIYDPTPTCKYNAWKFNTAGQLKLPENGICIENNHYKESLAGSLVSNFANVHFANSDITANLLPLADHNIPHDCPTAPASLLPEFVPKPGSYTPPPPADTHPTDAEIAAACGGGDPSKINYTALDGFNCPRLDQYRLFADNQNPTANPRGFGIPYNVNSILFADYAVKERFLFLPPGSDGKPVKATYEDHTNCDTINIYSCNSATLGFPVGTVFAKTFSYQNGTVVTPIETRLLIKRQNADGSVRWIGLPYIWQDDGNGGRVAMLHIEGGTASFSYNYDDPNPQVIDPSTNRVQHYGPGQVTDYQIPAGTDCLMCHGGDDREPGAAPIGPKVRNLNKTYDYPDAGVVNQLTYMQSKGLVDLPADPSKLEKMAQWNVPGSSGQAAGSPADINARARAYLEVNCQYCHNPAGAAQNSGLFLDAFATPIPENHGICKPPTAAGHAADYGDYDIVPGDAADSILDARLASSTTGVRMPPLDRTVVDTQAVTLISGWINNDVAQFAGSSAASCANQSSPLAPLAKPMTAHGMGG